MPKSKMTTGALRQTLMQAIDDVATGDLCEQKAGAIAKLAAQVNNSLLAEVEIMRAEIVGKVQGRDIGQLSIGEDSDSPKALIEHSPVPAEQKGTQQQQAQPQAENRRSMLQHTARIIDRRAQSGTSWNFGDPPPGRSALDQQRAREAATSATPQTGEGRP